MVVKHGIAPFLNLHMMVTLAKEMRSIILKIWRSIS